MSVASTILVEATPLPKHHSMVLDNGLEVVVIEMPNGTDVISVDIVYKVGSRNEVMGKTGIAHMLEHLNFKSTKRFKAGEFDKIVKSHGGINNASTSFDKTHYFIKTTAGNLEMALDLFSELMTNLKLDDKEFQTERDVVAEERRMRTDNDPMGYLYFRLFNTHFVYHPYRWLPIGFMRDILNWKIEDIKAFYHTYYQPKNAILIVAGDIKKERVFEAAKKYFGKIKNRSELPSFYFKEPKIDGAKRVVLFKKDNRVDTLAMAFAIPEFNHPDQVVLSAIAHILTGGKSSRFEKRIVHQKQLASTIYAYPMQLKDPSIFVILAMTVPGKDVAMLEKEILSELERLKKEGVSKEELEKVKVATRADFIFSLESSSSVASLFAEYLAKGDLKPLLEYEENLAKITSDDIKRVAKTYFDQNRSTTVILKKEEGKTQ